MISTSDPTPGALSAPETQMATQLDLSHYAHAYVHRASLSHPGTRTIQDEMPSGDLHRSASTGATSVNKIFEALHQLEAALRLMSAMRTIAPAPG